MDTMYNIVYNTRIFYDDCEKWDDKERVDKNCANFQVHFQVAQRKYNRKPTEDRTSTEYPPLLKKTVICLTDTIKSCVQDAIPTSETKEQGTQETRLNLEQSSVDMAENPENSNIKCARLYTF